MNTPRTDKFYEEVWRFTNETDAVDALISMRDLCRELERENAALREELEYAIKAGARREADLLVTLGKEAQPCFATWQWAKANPDSAARRIRELKRENTALRKDKERLDWLGSQKGQPWLCWETPLRLNRETLDDYRKEAQP